jgi:putative transposase
MRKTYKFKLNPTPQQERILDHMLMLCRHVYNAAIGERREAWRMRGVSVNCYHRKAELPGIKEEKSWTILDLAIRPDHIHLFG